MKNNLFFILSLLFISSCSEMDMVVELDIPDHEPVLVLNGVLDTDTTVSIILSHSLGAFEQGSLSNVSSAKVALYKDDNFADSLFADELNPIEYDYYSNENYGTINLFSYTCNHIPESEAVYRIEASHPNYKTVNASTYIPGDIALFNIQVDSISNSDYINMSFSFMDDPSQQNFYRVRALGDCSKSWMNEFGEEEEWNFDGRIELSSNDPSIQGDGIPFNGYTFVGEEALFTDVLFDGQQKSMSFDVQTDFFKWGDCDTVVLQFTVFSNDSYSYFNSLQEHSENGESGIFGGEIIPVYSNVEQGLGVLISANAQNLFLKP